MPCSQIPELSYTDFSAALHEKTILSRVPLCGTITLTQRCNLHCVHCYESVDPGQRELTTSQFKLILDKLAAAGCLFLLLTGGEPLLRKDFLELYVYAKTKGFIITLFTNGTLLTPAIADVLREYPPFDVEISLYGMTSQTYAKMTGHAEGLELTLQGIRLLLERKIPLKLKTMITTLNQPELWLIKEFVEKKLKTDFRFDALIWPRINGQKENTHYRLSPEQVVQLDVEDQKRYQGWQEFNDKYGRAVYSEKLFNCNAGKNSFAVDSYGQLRMCDMLRDPCYDLLSGSFQAGWEGCFSQMASMKHQKKEHPCRQCQQSSFCDICPAWSRLEGGEDEFIVDYLCQIAKLRAKEFGRENGKEKVSNAADQRSEIIT